PRSTTSSPWWRSSAVSVEMCAKTYGGRASTRLNCTQSLPLDRGRRLRADVERHAVHTRDLVDDPARDRLEQVVGKPRPVGRHCVVRGDRADHDRIGIGALVALDAHGLDRGQDGEALPELAIEAGAPHLLLEDGIGAAQDLEPLARDLADD